MPMEPCTQLPLCNAQRANLPQKVEPHANLEQLLVAALANRHDDRTAFDAVVSVASVDFSFDRVAEPHCKSVIVLRVIEDAAQHAKMDELVPRQSVE